MLLVFTIAIDELLVWEGMERRKWKCLVFLCKLNQIWHNSSKSLEDILNILFLILCVPRCQTFISVASWVRLHLISRYFHWFFDNLHSFSSSFRWTLWDMEQIKQILNWLNIIVYSQKLRQRHQERIRISILIITNVLKI